MNHDRVLYGAAPRARTDVVHTRPATPHRVDVDPDQLDRGLGRLVLAVLELLRQVIERQALRRVEGGLLDDAEVERLGRTLRGLEQRMGELRETFGLRRSDLDLGFMRIDDLVDERMAQPSFRRNT